MGNSADRAWQPSQLVEGVLTAFNPSHGSLSCVKTNSVSFASAQARKLNRSVCFSFPHEVCYFVGVPTMAGHCVSKQVGRHDAACQGCPRCVSRSPETRCLRVFARAVRFSPTCGVVRVADIKLSRYKEENISLLSLPKKQPCEYQIWRKKLHKFFERSYRTNRMNPKYGNQK